MALRTSPIEPISSPVVFKVMAKFSISPRSVAVGSAFALVFVTLAVLLYSDRDVAPIFGHLAPTAGEPHR